MSYLAVARQKLAMAKQGKDVTQFGEADANKYDIEDAEKDVEELRKIRRQIRCLFGPNVAVSGSNKFEAGCQALPQSGALPTAAELSQVELSPASNREGAHNAVASTNTASIHLKLINEQSRY